MVAHIRNHFTVPLTDPDRDSNRVESGPVKAVMSHDIIVSMWNGIGDKDRKESWRKAAICYVTSKLPYAAMIDMQFDQDHNLNVESKDPSVIAVQGGLGLLVKVEYRDADPFIFTQTGWVPFDGRLADGDPTGGSGFVGAFQKFQGTLAGASAGVSSWFTY